ncbi:predicted protein [Streptomyces viridosporus ATCC 14672]|uniref:Predicted protein n=1 Tax=Streptomyces viridosporus (strain ATCC 14672 / DSM 40746 / JCM 4963 / KCTC 9882 / NRRL B-12104 / FH 1290) TaxID=566461 RepID=D5ZYR9_STRV1|nr:predicted protein [Streptomyces viridosporus ATCC 14672]
MGGVADGVGDCLRGVAAGRREHAPSSVATSCDYRILPFGLSHSVGPPCQNRVTGDTRTAPLRYITTGDSPGIDHSDRKIFCVSQDADVSAAPFAALVGLLRVRPGLVLISDDDSGCRHVTFALWTRRRWRPSGKKVLHTPHPGLRARVRRARRVRLVPIHPSGLARSRPFLTRSGNPQTETLKG